MELPHCGLVTPYGDTELSQHWFGQWISPDGTNPLFDPMSAHDPVAFRHLTAIPHEIPQLSTTKFSFYIVYKKKYSII